MKMRWILKILMVITALLMVACASTGTYKGGVFESDEITFKALPPSGRWEKIDVEDVELAFWRKADNAVIMVNSTCKEYEDVPPEAMANHLMIGIVDRNIKVWEYRNIDKRKALYFDVEGYLDGALIRLAGYVLIKDYCTIDITLTADLDDFESCLSKLDDVAVSFHMRKRKDK